MAAGDRRGVDAAADADVERRGRAAVELAGVGRRGPACRPLARQRDDAGCGARARACRSTSGAAPGQRALDGRTGRRPAAVGHALGRVAGPRTHRVVAGGRLRGGAAVVGSARVRRPLARLRAGAIEAIQRLQADGVRTVLVSGDGLASAQGVAHLLGITEVHAEGLPGEKASLIAAWRSSTSDRSRRSPLPTWASRWRRAPTSRWTPPASR